MPDEGSFLRTILDTPLDDAPRLVYADWLEENDRRDGCPECEGYRFGEYTMPRCGTCHGDGVVGNGYAALAEFIRVQIELAEIESEHGTLLFWNQLRKEHYAHRPGCSKWCRLVNRQNDLLERHGREWATGVASICGYPAPFGTFGYGGGEDRTVSWVFHRGFIGRVELPAAVLLGGLCGCRAGGRIPVTDSYVVGCPTCNGSGTTPGIARQLALAAPVTEIVLSDLPIHPSGGNSTYYVGGLGMFPKEYWRRLEGLPSVAAANLALSRAAVDYCRQQAKLPPIKWPKLEGATT